MRVLVIEDDADIAEAVRVLLVRGRYAVDVAHDGDAGLELLLGGTYAAAIVDIGLPSRDGFSICRSARAEHVTTPLLVLTARDAVEDRIRGLDAGADDYLIKPFAAEELAARVRALVRRADRPPQATRIAVGSFVLDSDARHATVDGRLLDLGSTEFRLLELLARNRGITLGRELILEKIWDCDFEGPTNIVDVYVSHLRRKLRTLGADVQISTVWGVGYKLEGPASKRVPSSG